MRQALQKLGTSFLFGLIFFVIILGGMVTALAENQTNHPPTVTQTETSPPTSVPQRDTILNTPTNQSLPPSPSITSSPTSAATSIPSSTGCSAPAGWSSYTVQLGETLNMLATRYSIPAATLKERNCLPTDELTPNNQLFVPPYPTATPIPCGPPYNWTQIYTVKAGDNLFRIGLKYRVTILQLQQANCLGYSTKIKVGQQLYVPNVPTSTPATTNTPTPTQTFTSTNTPETPTATPVTPTETFTPLPEETDTPVVDVTPESEE